MSERCARVMIFEPGVGNVDLSDCLLAENYENLVGACLCLMRGRKNPAQTKIAR